MRHRLRPSLVSWLLVVNVLGGCARTALVDQPCDEALACTDAYRCVSGRCELAADLPVCESSADCRDDEVCDAFRCVPGLVPQDGGAVVPDGGLGDAGTDDAGGAVIDGDDPTDGGLTVDGGGQVDAAEPDAATPLDAGVEPHLGCGNGALEPGESCDDGNTSEGDGCNSTCELEDGQVCVSGASCASGICDATESIPQCEPANTCGNSELEAGESCDDGNTSEGDGCNSTCELEDGQVCVSGASCASGICDTTESTPQCEPANTCGNGALEAGEGCDDGNVTNGDGCNATCKLEDGAVCANGSSCASGICDATESPDRCEPANTCGNGVLETGEYCDDGNVTNGDGCNSTCKIEDGQVCASGSSCASGICDATESTPQCEPANTCGNGALEAGEACDDGNTIAGDWCDAACQGFIAYTPRYVSLTGVQFQHSLILDCPDAVFDSSTLAFSGSCIGSTTPAAVVQ
ncbi:MAG: DUF4215 domain-containing protein, partial [Myxococcota bacterium]